MQFNKEMINHMKEKLKNSIKRYRDDSRLNKDPFPKNDRDKGINISK